MASGSQSVGIDSHWHWDGAPRRGVTGNLSASFNGLTISASCSVTQSQRPGYPGHSSISDTVSLLIDGNVVGSSSIPMVGTNTRNLNGSMNVNPGVHTIQVTMACPDISNGSCTAGLHSPVVVGSITFDVPNPEVPPTNISGGRVYNQNNVVNGDDKPDWNFYVDWWGESAGTHSITKVNLDLYKSTNLNSIVASIDNVQKWIRYNFESLLPKCKPGEIYEFYTNVLIDNSYWLRKSSYRNYKII